MAFVPQVHTPTSAPAESIERDTSILNTVREGAGTRRHSLSRRRALEEKARYLTGFEHFRRLCLSDLRHAFHEDREQGTRCQKYRRLTWITLFRYFAEHRDIPQHLHIEALDRQGNYACELTDTHPEQETDWDKLVRMAKQFGIRERQLMALRREPGGGT